MDFYFERLSKEERVTLKLRNVYEKRGFKKFKMSKFEEYGFYLENKNFLLEEQLITFNDKKGRLLALKPDVTLSIAKNAKGINALDKLYYIESVFRYVKHTGEIKEIQQMGLEVMGDIDAFATLEVIELSLKSLEAIDENFVLDISHMGFLNGVVDSVNGIDEKTKAEILLCIGEKNIHDLIRTANESGISCSDKERLINLAKLSGSLSEALEKAKQLSVNDQTDSALVELFALSAAFQNSVYKDKIRLDFSIVNDALYYNGIIFKGYVEGVPKMVLSGGRYDLLMQKFKKNIGALGFALVIDDLGRYFKEGQDKILDEVILYDESVDPLTLSKLISEENDRGLYVCAVKSLPDFLYKKAVKIENGKLEDIKNA